MVIAHLDTIIHLSIQLIHQHNALTSQHENQLSDPFEQQHSDIPFGISPKNLRTKIQQKHWNALITSTFNVKIKFDINFFTESLESGLFCYGFLNLVLAFKDNSFNLPSYLYVKIKIISRKCVARKWMTLWLKLLVFFIKSSTHYDLVPRKYDFVSFFPQSRHWYPPTNTDDSLAMRIVNILNYSSLNSQNFLSLRRKFAQQIWWFRGEIPPKKRKYI